jgi:hypothetical protein
MASWYDSAVRSRRDIEVSHGRHVCKCGITLSSCKCPKNHPILSVSETCDHKWAVDIEEELDREYDIASYSGKSGRLLEVDLPVGRHSLHVSLTNIYGYVISLLIHDETGGLLKEVDLYTCLGKQDIADTVHSLYTSYE